MRQITSLVCFDICALVDIDAGCVGIHTTRRIKASLTVRYFLLYLLTCRNQDNEDKDKEDSEQEFMDDKSIDESSRNEDMDAEAAAILMVDDGDDLEEEDDEEEDKESKYGRKFVTADNPDSSLILRLMNKGTVTHCLFRNANGHLKVFDLADKRQLKTLVSLLRGDVRGCCWELRSKRKGVSFASCFNPNPSEDDDDDSDDEEDDGRENENDESNSDNDDSNVSSDDGSSDGDKKVRAKTKSTTKRNPYVNDDVSEDDEESGEFDNDDDDDDDDDDGGDSIGSGKDEHKQKAGRSKKPASAKQNNKGKKESTGKGKNRYH